MLLRGTACFVLVGLVACGSSDNATSNTSDLESGRGALTRQISPQLPVPTSDLIGAKLADVAATVTATAGTAKKSTDCSTTPYYDANKTVVYQRVDCTASLTIRFLNAGGTMKEEHADLNKDGLVDRYTNESAKVAQYTDANFDGKIDVVVERVDQLTDFSLVGYPGEDFPAAAFLYRIREDRNRDGGLDYETLSALGALPGGS